MKICPKCGTEVERLFCPDCGTRVEEEKKVEEENNEMMVLPHFDGEEQYYHQKTVDDTIDGMAGKISAKSTGIIAYITWIGLIIALIIGDKEGGKFHLNQALVIYLASLICGLVGPLIPILGGLVVFVGNLFCLVCWGLGLYYACTGQEREVPLLGQIRLL